MRVEGEKGTYIARCRGHLKGLQKQVEGMMPEPPRMQNDVCEGNKRSICPITYSNSKKRSRFLVTIVSRGQT